MNIRAGPAVDSRQVHQQAPSARAVSRGLRHPVRDISAQAVSERLRRGHRQLIRGALPSDVEEAASGDG